MRVESHCGLAVTLCLVLAVAPAPAAALQYGASIESAGRPKTTTAAAPAPDHGHSSILPFLIGLVAVGSAVAIVEGSKKETPTPPPPPPPPPPASDGPTADQLLGYGPDVVELRLDSAFAVYGFMRNNWPIVLDYNTDPASATWLTVTINGKTWTQRLPSGRQTIQVPYRGGGASGATPALLAVQSATQVKGGQGQPGRVDMLAIGAGPGAVGSPSKRLSFAAPAVLDFASFQPGADWRSHLIRTDLPFPQALTAIGSLSFAASARKVGVDFAHFGYSTATPFDHLDMEILHFSSQVQKGETVINMAPVAQWGLEGPQPGPFGPRVWDGRVLATRATSHGLHGLQVRGWQSADDTSWLAAQSLTQVTVP